MFDIRSWLVGNELEYIQSAKKRQRDLGGTAMAKPKPKPKPKPLSKTERSSPNIDKNTTDSPTSPGPK